jgi:hypothetical protein
VARLLLPVLRIQDHKLSNGIDSLWLTTWHAHNDGGVALVHAAPSERRRQRRRRPTALGERHHPRCAGVQSVREGGLAQRSVMCSNLKLMLKFRLMVVLDLMLNLKLGGQAADQAARACRGKFEKTQADAAAALSVTWRCVAGRKQRVGGKPHSGGLL